MFVAHLVWPGSFIRGDNNQDVANVVRAIAKELDDAAISLELYVQSNYGPMNSEEYGKYRERKVEIEKRLMASAGTNWTDDVTRNQAMTSASIILLNEIAGNGEIPRGYIDRLRFLHAKSFTTALDTIRKLLLKLKQMPLTSTQAASGLAAFDSAMPNLKGVRDSTVHIEDRIMRLARGKPIQIKSAKLPFVAGGGTPFIHSALYHDTFMTTLADGTVGDIDITVETLKAAQKIVQDLLDGLPWRTPSSPTVTPSI